MRMHETINQRLPWCSLRLLILVVVLSMTPVFAQEAPHLTLKDVAQTAVLNNPEVLARWHAFREATEEVDVARGGFLPKLDFSAGAAREMLKQPAVGLDNNFYRRTRTLSLNQMLFDGFATISEVRRLGKTKLVRYFELLDASENVALEAGRAYIDVLRSRYLVFLAEENYIQHQVALEQLKQRSQSGVGKRVDVEQAASRLALADVNVTTAYANLHDVTARYVRFVGEQPPKVMFVPAQLSKLLPESAEAALQVALKSNPALRASIENIEASQHDLEARRANFMPRFDLRARNESINNYLNTPGYRDDSVLEMVMSYNLFNGGSDGARSRQYRERKNAALDQREKSCRDMRQTLSIAYNETLRLTDQQTFISVQVGLVEKTRAAYRDQFNIGQRTLLDLLNTQNEFFDARRAQVNANADLAIAYLRTYAGMGRLLEYLGLKRLDSDDSPDEQELASVDLTQLCPPTKPADVYLDREALSRKVKEFMENPANNFVSSRGAVPPSGTGVMPESVDAPQPSVSTETRTPAIVQPVPPIPIVNPPPINPDVKPGAQAESVERIALSSDEQSANPAISAPSTLDSAAREMSPGDAVASLAQTEVPTQGSSVATSVVADTAIDTPLQSVARPEAFSAAPVNVIATTTAETTLPEASDAPFVAEQQLKTEVSAAVEPTEKSADVTQADVSAETATAAIAAQTQSQISAVTVPHGLVVEPKIVESSIQADTDYSVSPLPEQLGSATTIPSSAVEHGVEEAQQEAVSVAKEETPAEVATTNAAADLVINTAENTQPVTPQESLAASSLPDPVAENQASIVAVEAQLTTEQQSRAEPSATVAVEQKSAEEQQEAVGTPSAKGVTVATQALDQASFGSTSQKNITNAMSATGSATDMASQAVVDEPVRPMREDSAKTGVANTAKNSSSVAQEAFFMATPEVAVVENATKTTNAMNAEERTYRVAEQQVDTEMAAPPAAGRAIEEMSQARKVVEIDAEMNEGQAHQPSEDVAPIVHAVEDLSDSVISMDASKLLVAQAIAPEAEVAQRIIDWIVAWEARDVTKYLAFYALDFKPQGGLDRAAWERKSEEGFARIKNVHADIQNLAVRLQDNELALTEFRQTYVADTVRYSAHKTMEWRKENGQWRIVREMTRMVGRK